MRDCEPPVLGANWVVEKELGTGAFSVVVLGTVYAARHRTTGQVAAIKYSKTAEDRMMIAREGEILASVQGCGCIPHIDVPALYEVVRDPRGGYISMEVTGNSIEKLRKTQPFSSLTVALLGVQLVTALEALHGKEYIHRDIKTDNFAISANATDQKIYLLDLGAATRYAASGVHVRYSESCPFVGNHVFCSLNVLQGIRPSRRDDMESLGYSLVYLFRHHLPWMKLGSSDVDTRTEHLERKVGLTPTKLCRGLDPEYSQYIEYCRALRFEEKPDYEFLRGLIIKAATRHGFDGTIHFDWTQRIRPLVLKKPPSRRRESLSKKMQDLSSPDSGPGEKLERLTAADTPECIFLGRSSMRKDQHVITSTDGDATPPTKNTLRIDAVRAKLKQWSNL